MQIVTTGKKYADIDGYACVIAYAELQKLLGKECFAVIQGKINQSVTKSIQGFGFKYSTELPLSAEGYTFSIMDVSEPSHFPDFVNIEYVNVVYDHHFGFEEYWQDKIGKNAKIEEIGAAATFVFEDIVENGKLEEINPNILFLLYTAIISNSLDLKASVTKDRDRKAVETILKTIVIPSDWNQRYFEDVYKEVFMNPEESIRNDTKIIEVGDLVLKIFQLEFWNSQEFIRSNWNIIWNFLQEDSEEIKFFDIPTISENKTYFITANKETKELLNRVVGVQFDGDIGVLDKLILRKEIIKLFQKIHGNTSK